MNEHMRVQCSEYMCSHKFSRTVRHLLYSNCWYA
jgi:hypothetical protein